MFNKQHDLKSDLHSPQLGRKKIWDCTSSLWDYTLKLLKIIFSEYFESFQSGAISLLSCPIFHFKNSFTQKYFHFSLWFVLAEGKASSYDIVHILNVSLGTSNNQHAIDIFKECIEEKKILIKLLFISFWILNNAFSAYFMILLQCCFADSLLLANHILRLTKCSFS